MCAGAGGRLEVDALGASDAWPFAAGTTRRTVAAARSRRDDDDGCLLQPPRSVDRERDDGQPYRCATSTPSTSSVTTDLPALALGATQSVPPDARVWFGGHGVIIECALY